MMIYRLTFFMKAILFFVVCALIVIPTISSQNIAIEPNVANTAFNPNIFPPSPEASALAKYAEIPVSLYTGTPEISIPLYEIVERDIKVPISLAYHASGNKVETYAPRTGMGWSLLAGGVVTRAVRGGPDEYGDRGFLKQAERYDGDIGHFYEGTNQEKYERYDPIARGCTDIEPDLFYFNFAGYSGKFMFGWDGQIKYGSGDYLVIEPIGLNESASDFIDGWKVSTPDGLEYTFESIESNKTLLDADDILGSPCTSFINNLMVPQAWYLTKIRSNKTNSEVYFSYTNYTMRVEHWSMETISHNQYLAPAIPSRKKQQITTYGKYLSEISTSSNQVSINFQQGDKREDISVREDMLPFTVYTLGSVEIEDQTGRTIKVWDLGYKNTSNGLFLKSVQETGKRWDPVVTESSKPPYTFEYYGEGMPDQLSFSRDHWGFYNGRGNSTLVPATSVITALNPDPIELDGADRSPNFSSARVGTIKTINYPTGGSDHFQFESNDYSFKLGQEMIEEIVIKRRLQAEAPEPGVEWPSTSTDIQEFTLIGKTDLLLSGTYTCHFGGFGGGVFMPVLTIRKKSSGEEIFRRAFSPGECDDFSDCTLLIDQTVRDVPAGTYELIASAKVAPPEIGTFHVNLTLSWDEATGEYHTLTEEGGGIRIAKITTKYGYDSPDKVKKYEYQINKENGEVISSGSLLDAYFIYEKWITHVSTSGLTGHEEPRFDRFSVNRTSLGTTHGSPVGYSQVTVIHGEHEENGRTLNKYTSPIDYPDYAEFDLPFPPPRSYEYKRGLLTEQWDFASGSDIPTHKIINHYSFHSEGIPAIKVGWAKPGGGNFGSDYLDRYAYKGYTTLIGYGRLTQRKEVFRDAFNDLENTVTFVYNESGNKQLRSMSTFNSEHKEIVTEFKYPDDYPSGSDAALDLMKDKHILTQPVERVRYYQASSKMLLSGEKTDFGIFHGLPLPAKTWNFKLSNPVFTSVPFSVAQSKYAPVHEFHHYDNRGNLLQGGQPNGVKISYWWDTKKLNPLGQTVNSAHNQVYHNGFETGFASTHRFTGKASKYQSGKYYIPTASLPQVAGNYVLTYWAKRGSADWVMEEKKLTGYTPGTSIRTNTINGYLDELRLYPEQSQMTTYAYESQHGLISACDPNHVTVHHEYDEFGRLVLTRDHHGDIIEGYEYHFKE